MFKLALAQIRVEGGRPADNLRRAVDRIDEAASAGAKLVVLPEALDLGWTHPSAQTQAAPIPDGGPSLVLREAARRKGVFVCAGLTERAGGAVFNSAVLIDPGGTVVLCHRKLNELEIGHAFYGQGDRLSVARTRLGTIGIMVCADGFARGQTVSRALGLMGADLILSPCAWACEPRKEAANSKSIRERFRKRTTESPLFLIGANSVGELTEGPWEGRILHGRSLAYGPGGREVVAGDFSKEQVLCCDVA